MKGDAVVGAYLYCAADDTLSWDEVHLMPAVHERIGDMAVGIVIATLFSQRAQQKLELASGTLDANLQTDCFTGVWAGAAKTGELNPSLPPEARLTLSPGDLDEAIAGFLVFSRHGDGSDRTSKVGSAFQRVASFRAGFFETFTGGLSAGMKRCVTGSAG
jgi:predicted metalloprotease